jgi:hypothetical protein
MDEPRSRFVDLAFTLQGSSLPRDHRQALAAALLQALPWLGSVPGAGVHRLNVSAGGGAHALLRALGHAPAAGTPTRRWPGGQTSRWRQPALGERGA